MGRKGYNWKAREVVTTVIDDAPTKKIKLDFEAEGKYDQSNELVLPSEKRKTKIKDDRRKVTRILSKKQRKKLEKIVDKKKKKENRKTILEALNKVQATPEELQNLTSIASIQTKGLKRHFWEQANESKIKLKNDTQVPDKINSIAGSKRQPSTPVQNDIDDPNVVGFESSGSDSEGNVEEIQQIVEVEAPSFEPPKIVVDKIEDAPKLEVKRTPVVYVEVERDPEIQKARLKLPIIAEEQQIMETINENSVVILAGETGSGKTTQVPQFLYEAGYACKRAIGVTEPRRVAAISMSSRVAEEMNLSSKEVSYLIRFEGNATEDTKIKFMTDGVLLQEIKSDFFLSKYSVVVLDEAHERSVYTDILIGLLSRIVPLRLKKGDPLKLIIMSATLRLRDFTDNKRLFRVPPPVIKVDARQFSVSVHFNKRTNDDYMREAFRKTAKIHTTLPDGGVLVFLTGQREVNSLVRQLRKTFPIKHKDKVLQAANRIRRDKQRNKDASGSDEEIEENLKKSLKCKKKFKIIPEIDLDDYGLPEEPAESDSEAEFDEDFDADACAFANAEPMWVVPMYSLLPTTEQSKVFEAPPPGCRLCVVSTNVAETSLTIPNVKYVVDSGKTKMKLYDKTTGVTSYAVMWTSKASADQRAGRAGRTGPGHCYRLYSSAVFNDVFPEFALPEIQQKPVDDLFLQMRCMNIQKVANFPFPTAPDLLQLKTAEHRLEILGAVKNSEVTPLGRAIAKFPVLPRFGKMLALSHQQGLLPYTVCMVAALSVQEVLLETPIGYQTPDEIKTARQKWFTIRRQWAGVGNSLLLGDPMVLLRAVGAAEYANADGMLEKFCAENGLRHKAVLEIRKLRLQLTNEIKTNVPNVEINVDPELKPPSDLQAKLLRQILLSGMGDQIAKKISPEEVKEKKDLAKFKYAYRANNMEEPVYLHQGSVLKKTLPDFVVFQEIYETNKMYMRGVTAVEPEWLPSYVPTLCNLTEPIADPPPRFDKPTGKVLCTLSGTFGTQAWPLPNVELEHPNTLDAYKWFVRFFLDGIVFEKLGRYAKSLLHPSGTVCKSWAHSQPRIVGILQALTRAQCRTRGKLESIWEDDPKFLLDEYLKWLPESARSEVSLCWPPLDD